VSTQLQLINISYHISNHFGFRRGKELGMQFGCWKNIRSNFGHRRGIVCVFYGVAEGI
jgi:hypothetical protein